MHMQESLVSVNDGTSQLRLSGALSEWLFSSHFWSDFNVKHNTMFDQFEEDEVDMPIVEEIIEALSERMCVLGGQDKSDIEFVYRWTPESRPLTTSISKKLLLSELVTFRDFLASAVDRSHNVTFSL